MKALLKASALLVSTVLATVHGWDEGEAICYTGYIMDQYCIDLGHFLDMSDSVTLAEPENHSFHCLLDVPRCYESGFVILTDKDPNTGMHCIGARLDDTQALMSAGFATGKDDGYCTGCVNTDADAPTNGFQVTIKATVKENGDGTTDTVSGAPLLENIQVLDYSVGCDAEGGETDLKPVCLPIPTAVPTLAPEPEEAPEQPADSSNEGSSSLSSCPDTLDESMQIPGTQSTLFYAVVPDSSSGSGDGIFCGRLEVENDGWIGLGFSPSSPGTMQGSDAVVGVPGDGTVLKYDLDNYTPVAMSADKQTLRDTSISEVDGKTTMTFTKLLVEDGEVPIVEGENNFLHAWGGSVFSYHAGRTAFTINIAGSSTESPSSSDIKVGDEVCLAGYIMDQYCIDLGHFLDMSDSVTLAEPENHSFHCLLDVPLCYESGYVVLADKDPNTGMHCLGYRLEESEVIREAGFGVGSDDGYCTGCRNTDSNAPTTGYQATVKGTVKEVGDGSASAAGTPLLGDIEISSSPCEATTVNPVCLPTAEQSEDDPSETPDETIDADDQSVGQDCSQDFCEQQVSAEYLLRYKINVPEGTTEAECESSGCTISMEAHYSGEGWVAIGFSTNGAMVGSEAVIGLNPGVVPLKYNLAGQDVNGVQPMPESKQTLTDASVSFEDGNTILRFTKTMYEEGEIPITTGDNIFLEAYGTSDTLGYHANRGIVNINLASGSSEALTAPNMSAWLAHGIMAFLAWGVFVPFAVQSSLLRSLLPEGPMWFNLHRAFNVTGFALFIAAFAVAVAYVAKENEEHFSNSHEKMGLAMFIMAFVQVLGGIVRPHLPDSDDTEKSSQRKGWEIGHRLLGVCLLACGFWQMQEGIQLYAIIFSVDETSENGVTIAYWVWIGIMSAIIVLGAVLRLKKQDDDDAEAPVENMTEAAVENMTSDE